MQILCGLWHWLKTGGEVFLSTGLPRSNCRALLFLILLLPCCSGSPLVKNASGGEELSDATHDGEDESGTPAVVKLFYFHFGN